MTKVVQSSAPFGTQSSRFNVRGIHPNMFAKTGHIPYESTHITSATKNLAPGSYNLLTYGDFSEKNVARRAEGPNWEKALYTEKSAKMPHLLFRETFEKRKEVEKRLGPGSYNLKDGLDLANLKPRSKRGMLNALGKRFEDEYVNVNPGPGAYGVPDEKLQEKQRNQGGKVPLFERSNRPRSLPPVGSDVAPGTYNHKNSIDELLRKKCSNRGPYDLFSIVRSDDPTAGHGSKNITWNLGPGQYNLNSFVDDLKERHNTKRGKFGKLQQYPSNSGDRQSLVHVSLHPKQPSFPGPGHYEPQELSTFKKNLPAFGMSSKRTDKLAHKFFLKNFNVVGVGRFDIERQVTREKERKLAHQSAVFESKSSQIASPKFANFYKERLEPHNLHKSQKVNLQNTGNVYGRVITA